MNDLINRKISILALSLSKGVGFFTIRKLYASFKRLEEFEKLSFDELEKIFVKAEVKYADRVIHDFLENKERAFKEARTIYNGLLGSKGVSFILDEEQLFPKSLKNIPDKPFWLFAQGDLELLGAENAVAIVGTRHPTQKGVETTEKLTELLVKAGYVIISGLAEGIDAAAHTTTNRLKGKGVAILGTGINLGFPAKTLPIRRELIANGGLALSEYTLSTNYSKMNFVFRDRLQSGLAKVVFPVQAPLKSGTFHTVKYAELQNRRIIGVFDKERENVKQNEVLSYLEQKKYSIYDVSKDSERLLKEVEETKSIFFKEPKQYLFDLDKTDISVEHLEEMEAPEPEISKSDKEVEQVPKKMRKSAIQKIIDFFNSLF